MHLFIRGVFALKQVSEFGFLVDPKDAEKISDIILDYIKNPELYQNHALNADKAFREKYNWLAIKDFFLQCIKTN